MTHFFEVLTSEGKHKALPEEFDYFGKIKGAWHFSWILEGMAIQDVIVLPGFECGTTLRVYNPVTHAWDIAYCYTGKIMRFEARKQEGKIVLTSIEDKKRKWVFNQIEDNHFHWQDVSVKKDGEWQVNFDLYAERAQ